MISQLGQSQSGRTPKELGVHFADVDDRTSEDLLLLTKKFAEFVNYYRDNISAPSGNWMAFFGYDEKAVKQLTVKQLLEDDTGSTPPHLALFLTFLELYKRPQEVINRITSHHLEFYYKKILRMQNKPAVADKAHVLIELKKNASPVIIGPDHFFSAGKDKPGVELIYAPSRDTVINSARVDSLRSIYLDKRGHGTVRYAPIANSSDGVGGELRGDEPAWYGFGHEGLPPAEVGFAIASPVLRMMEGERKVIVTLTLNNVDRSKISDSALKSAFEVFVTGEKHWLGPYSISPVLTVNDQLIFDFTIPESEKAVIDYDAAIHGYSYIAQAPVVQILLKSGNAASIASTASTGSTISTTSTISTASTTSTSNIASTAIGYNDLKGITLVRARVQVEVSKVKSLNLESDAGVLDPKKAFIPFGPQPTRGTRFMVGYTEALSKKLSEVKIDVQWKDAPVAPDDFAARYKNYGKSGINNSYFKATVSFKDGGSWDKVSHGIPLFESANASSPHSFLFTAATGARAPSGSPATISEGMKVHALKAAGSDWSMRAAGNYTQIRPVLTPYKTAEAEPRSGFITFYLENDFLHSTYRTEYVRNVMTYSKTGGNLIILNEPYTPAIQDISLSYKAYSDEVNISGKAPSGRTPSGKAPSSRVSSGKAPSGKSPSSRASSSRMSSGKVNIDFVNIGSAKMDVVSAKVDIDSALLADFSNTDLHFFHIAYFGQMREHRYQREQFEFLADKNVSLLPLYSNEGELLIGFKDLNPNDSVSVLFQVAEGSNNPGLEQEDIAWSVLCDNYWKPLGKDAVVLDTTNQLLASGIITFIIPAEATTGNTILPGGLVWIKAAISQRIPAVCHVTAVCQLIFVSANAVEVQFKDNGNDPGHLATALEKGKITKLRTGLPSVKSVKQPYASFGGRQAEPDDAFHTRVSERLRHKNRCITAWDYERIILEAFPGVHKVKCIPHAKGNCWLAPGNVLIVAVPDLKNKNARDLLQPKVDADTISRITSCVQARAGMQVQVHVKNPNYQKIQLDFKVKFHTGYEFNYYSQALNQALLRFLSPWAYEADREISFGGKVYKSVLLNFVEELDYVDYVTDFKMYSCTGTTPIFQDLAEVQPEAPDVILVSADMHIIKQA